ncbi:MAG TPA: hypothetical protein VH438_07070 [Gemmatimonadales bacterium]|jgi:hypothetical protein
MKYFHRTHLPPDQVMARATAFFGPRLAPTDQAQRGRRFSGSLGQIGVSVQMEGGHYTLVTVETNQPGESEADKLAKRFLTVVHSMADPAHEPRGAY